MKIKWLFLNSKINKLVVRQGGRLILLAPNEINWVEARRGSVCFHTSYEAIVVRHNLWEAESRLDPLAFKRVSRSALVNLWSIKQIYSSKNQYQLLLMDGTVLNCTEQFRKELERLLSMHPKTA